MEEQEEHKKTHDHKHHKRNIASKESSGKVFTALGIILIIVALYNVFQTSSLSSVFNEKIKEAELAAKPAEVQLTIITTPSCEDCFDISSAVSMIESTGVNVTSKKEVEFLSPESLSLVEEYQIERVPTVIITGEINKSRSLGNKLRSSAEKKGEAYVFTKVEPPFIDANVGKVRGKISLIHIRKYDCEKCFNLTPFISQLSDLGLKFEEQRTVSSDSKEGRELIKKYDIKKLPTVIMDKEAEVYPTIAENWDNMGSIEEGNYFVMRQVSPPYYDVDEGRLKGLVSMKVLLDSSCGECYDPNRFHKPILQQMGVVFDKEEEIDVSSDEGKELIKKYDIEKVPTIILTGDVEEYPVLVNAWKSVGTNESDGAYVFRAVEVSRQAYKNLTSGEVIGGKASSSSKTQKDDSSGKDEAELSSVKDFNVTAKQWEFTPKVIRVKLGDTVRLHVKSIDVTHGLALPDFGI
ncbi:hypothetical protein D6745_03095, partial [Candidatus Woesearchaeota archaeon]